MTNRHSARFMESLHLPWHMRWDHEPDRSERRSPDPPVSLANVNMPTWNSAFRFMESLQSQESGAHCDLEPVKARIEHPTSNIQHPTLNIQAVGNQQRPPPVQGKGRLLTSK
jgi:hypothetical protein